MLAVTDEWSSRRIRTWAWAAQANALGAGWEWELALACGNVCASHYVVTDETASAVERRASLRW